MSNVIPFPRRHTEEGLWEPWVSDKTVARHFGVHPRTVRRWREQGLPSRMVGGSRRYRLSVVEQWTAK